MLHIIRSFSSSSIVRELIRPPVHVFGLDGSYATALYSAATKLNQLSSIEKDFDTIKNELKNDTKLKEMIEDPVVKSSEKADAIKTMATKVNLTTASTNLLVVLAENNRLQRLEGVASAFSTIMAGVKGRLICYVTTAKPLDEEDRAQLDNVLKSFAKKGEEIVVEVKVDPSLIGGMIVKAGDKYVDMSIASKIKKYTDIINNSIKQGSLGSLSLQPAETKSSDCDEDDEKK
ncbi:ATP synthase subunit O, mitochondrial-like [Cimex lectularius]|uniref:ATP synthase peripheral stalk subunit OSCP, mitochondrial n=1 Tax=Cimex lectularius TaxID=79782 RepID=A0A8I6RX81_CIMLE|nr:ATP synthase subunit O, mitochondrial-like [Cimex lectularius]